jgi:RNA polymerase sigma-70 factor (ECF subfamily)
MLEGEENRMLVELAVARANLPENATETTQELLTALIERARAGDSSAFEQLMIIHQRKVFSVAWRLLGNSEDARDAVQEVFLRVHKYLDRFSIEQEFSGWLYRIAVNVCRDIGRKRSAQVTSLDAEIESGKLNGLASLDDAESAAIVSQERRIIAAALDTLSKKERAAIVLRDLEGMSTEDVARILDSSPATVRSQISSARAKIKQYRDSLLKGRRPKVNL